MFQGKGVRIWVTTKAISLGQSPNQRVLTKAQGSHMFEGYDRELRIS